MSDEKEHKILDVLTAQHLVSKGKANPEQQVIAHKYYLHKIEENKKDIPKKQTKELSRNILVHALIKYNEKEGIQETKESIYNFVAEQHQIKPSTVKREYLRWLSTNSEAKRINFRQRKSAATVESISDDSKAKKE